mmetsp:Transcript_47753/g.83586  ORF Transcript_47753/g.83586 Transcript_47753/m.83586 type:complete len:620 (+) Transcript_47753:167-2026(+)
MLLGVGVLRHGLLFFVIVEVGAVQLIADWRTVRGGFSLRDDAWPVDRAEERVVDDLLNAPAEVAETEGRVDREELLDQSDVLGIHPCREGQHLVGRDDVLEDLRGVVSLKRRPREVQLVDEAAECPVVHTLIVALGHDDFRSQVLRCAAESVGLVLLHAILQVRELLGETKVNHLQVALAVDQQVLRLKVAVSNALVVKVLEGQHHVGGVKLDRSHVETAARTALHSRGLLVYVGPQLASLDELHQHEDLVLVVVGLQQLQDERRRRAFEEQILLGHNVALLVRGHHFGLVHALQRTDLSGALVLHHLDATKGARTNGAHDLEVLEAKRRTGVEIDGLFLRGGLLLDLAVGHGSHQVLLNVSQQGLEASALKHQALHGPAGDHVGLAHLVGDQRTLAEELLCVETHQLFFLAAACFQASAAHLTFVDDVETRALLALTNDIRTILEGLHAHHARQLDQLVLGELREQRHALQDANAHLFGEHVLHGAHEHVELNPVQRQGLHAAHGNAVRVAVIVQHQRHLTKIVSGLQSQEIHFLASGLDLRAFHGTIFDHVEGIANLTLADDIVTVFVHDGLEGTSQLADLLIAERVQEGTLFQKFTARHHLGRGRRGKDVSESSEI